MPDYTFMEGVNNSLQTRKEMERLAEVVAEEERLETAEKRAAFLLGVVTFLFFSMLAVLIP